MKYKYVAAWLLSAMFAFGVLTNMQSESFGQNQERGMRGGQRGQRGQGGQRGGRGGQRGGQRGGRGGDDGSALVKGEIAPDFVLKSLDGESETKLSEFKGKKPVILFFGSYT